MIGNSDDITCDGCEYSLDPAAVHVAYDIQRARIKELANSGAGQEILAKEHARLKMLKKKHAELVQACKSLPKTAGRGHAFYPPSMTLPRDADDPRFVQSFAVDDGQSARAFMDEYGFVVFKNAISSADCERTRDEIWAYLEGSVDGFDRQHAETWKLLSETETGRYYDAYGLPPDPVIMSPQLLQNRQNENVVRAFQTILEEDILVSHDRWCLYRHTHGGVGKPTRMNLHLDLHPWRFLSGNTRIDELEYPLGHDHEFPLEIPRACAKDGPHVQGVLNLVDNVEEDGGTQLVPGFHRVFNQWQADLGDESEYAYHPGREANWIQPGNGGASFKFHENDPIYALAHRVPLREGSLLIWDQRLVHGSCPNASSRVRMAQFIRAFRRAPLSTKRATSRAFAVLRKIDAAGLRAQVSDVGKRVFGFHDLPSDLYPVSSLDDERLAPLC